MRYTVLPHTMRESGAPVRCLAPTSFCVVATVAGMILLLCAFATLLPLDVTRSLPSVLTFAPAPHMCTEESAQAAAAVLTLQRQQKARELSLARPSYCRLDSWIVGNWTTDGQVFLPRLQIRTDAAHEMLPLGPQDRYHMYNTQETRDCLRGRKVYWLGPSYTRDCFTTLVDLLHGETRTDKYTQMNPPPLNMELLGPGFEHLSYVSVGGFFQHYFQRMLPAMDYLANQTVIADVLIWDIMEATQVALSNDAEMVTELYFLNLRRFLTLTRAHNVTLIWMTQMNFDNSDVGGWSTVPERFRSFQTPSLLERYLARTIPMLQEFGVPWLDVFHMTGSCITPKEELDLLHNPCNPSAHSNWYVSRMKVQMVLNYLCRCEGR